MSQVEYHITISLGHSKVWDTIMIPRTDDDSTAGHPMRLGESVGIRVLSRSADC